MLYFDGASGETRHLPPGMYLVKCPTRKGIGDHFGVLAIPILPWSKEEVFELTDKGHFLVDLESFANGGRVMILDRLPEGQVQEAITRARKLINANRNYNLIDYNCEHAARYVISGKLESHQIGNVLLACIGIFLVVALAK